MNLPYTFQKETPSVILSQEITKSWHEYGDVFGLSTYVGFSLKVHLINECCHSRKKLPLHMWLYTDNNMNQWVYTGFSVLLVGISVYIKK